MKDKIVELRSQGEAHLYLAVAKADDEVSTKEQVTAFYYSEKCKSIIDLLKLDPEIKKSIVDDIKELLKDPNYLPWNANTHLQEAIILFKKAKQLGDYSVNLIAEKHSEGLQKLAEVDGYFYKESQFLKKIKDELKDL